MKCITNSFIMGETFNNYRWKKKNIKFELNANFIGERKKLDKGFILMLNKEIIAVSKARLLNNMTNN